MNRSVGDSEWVIALKCFGGVLAFSVGVVFLIVFLSYQASEFYDAHKTPETRAAEAAAATPHFYSSVDGCAVYTWFANGHNHYFTKCGTKVITEAHHTEYCGKACSRDVVEKIETEGAK